MVNLLEKGETQEENIIMRGNTPVAVVIAGKRVALGKTKVAPADETVLKQEVLSIDSDTFLLQTVRAGEEQLFRWSKTFINTGADGMPLGAEGYVSKAGKPYKTAQVDGLTVGLRTVFEAADAQRVEAIAAMQRLSA